MNKIYIQVHDLLREYGVPFDELLQLVKSGKLTLFAMIRSYDYEPITSFDSYVDNWIARKLESLERLYINNITHIQYPSERISRANSIGQSIRERYHGQRTIRKLGIDEIITQKHNKAMKELADRDGVARCLAIGLFVKIRDYENMANSGNLRKQSKREAPEIRIKETLDACQFVERVYGTVLLNKLKNDVRILVKIQMNFKEPYTPTFNEWFTKCPYTKRQGNPNFTKKPA